MSRHGCGIDIAGGCGSNSGDDGGGNWEVHNAVITRKDLFAVAEGFYEGIVRNDVSLVINYYGRRDFAGSEFFNRTLLFVVYRNHSTD